MVAKSSFFVTTATAAVIVMLGSQTAARAQATSSATGSSAAVSCLVEPAKLPAEDVEIFVSSPLALLSDRTSGAATESIVLGSRVRALAASSSETLDKLLGLVSSASDTQISAIGAGLSRAATTCFATQAEYAALIQTKVAEINNASLIAGFTGATDEIQTAALGGAGAAAGPGAGAGGIGTGGEAGGGTAGLGDDEGVAQGIESFGSTTSRSIIQQFFITNNDNPLSPTTP